MICGAPFIFFTMRPTNVRGALKCTNHLIILNKVKERETKQKKKSQINNIMNENWTMLLNRTEIKEY